MKKLTTYPLIFLLLTLGGCEKVFLHPASDNSNQAVFEEYVKICTEKFALSEVKNVDLYDLADSIRPLINESLSDQELFDLMSILTLRMKEGHTSLKSKKDGFSSSYLYFLGYPLGSNSIIMNNYYYGNEANPNVQIIEDEDENGFFDIKYGYFTQSPNIGYIRITSFFMEASDESLNQMMNYLQNADGLVIDVRGNLGGYINLGARIASYFTDSRVRFGTNQVKNGPEPNDFADTPMYLDPSGSDHHFDKPVMVLTDRVTFSTGSLFTVMMSALPQVTTAGIVFGGGTGEITDGLLSNGWIYHISTSNLLDHEGNPTDNGIIPDIPLGLEEGATESDAIIDQVIQELNK